MLPSISVRRRQFLRNSTGVLMGVLAADSTLALLAPARVWAVDLAALSSDEAATLLAMTRTIAPHDGLEDLAYAFVVRAVDGEAASDEGLRALLKEGIADLGVDFAGRDEAGRVAALQHIESSPFFQTMRVKTLQVLYSTPAAYAYFGYEGEAFSKGGYLARGFDDLRWLPAVPLEDSGPKPGGA